MISIRWSGLDEVSQFNALAETVPRRSSRFRERGPPGGWWSGTHGGL